MKNCRICGAVLPAPFFSLGNAPPSNAFLTSEQLDLMEPYYPLDVFWCQQCSLVQIGEYKMPEGIFDDQYIYYSSHSTSWLEQCNRYANEMINCYSFNEKSLILEIASNDGYLLQFFKKANVPVFGVEPSSGCATAAKKIGIPTDIAFFSSLYAKKIRDEGIFPDLIICNNVLAHTPHLHDFVEGLKIILPQYGLITIEFPHLLQLLKKCQFDTIYHEHYSYFSLHALIRLFGDHGLNIVKVEKLTTHGGSLRIYVRHDNVGGENSLSIKEILDEEISFGILMPDIYSAFGDSVYRVRWDLLKYLIHAKEQGRTVVGYGAPAKGNTLLNFCGVRRDLLGYTVDISPVKQGKFLPGTHIPVFHPHMIMTNRPDEILILPWNLADEIMKQLSFIKDWGGKFVIPIPYIQVIG